MYCLYGNSSWYIDCCPLYGRCPLLGVSVIGGSTVLNNYKIYYGLVVYINFFYFCVVIVFPIIKMINFRVS